LPDLLLNFVFPPGLDNIYWSVIDYRLGPVLGTRFCRSGLTLCRAPADSGRFGQRSRAAASSYTVHKAAWRRACRSGSSACGRPHKLLRSCGWPRLSQAPRRRRAVRQGAFGNCSSEARRSLLGRDWMRGKGWQQSKLRWRALCRDYIGQVGELGGSGMGHRADVRKLSVTGLLALQGDPVTCTQPKIVPVRRVVDPQGRHRIKKARAMVISAGTDMAQGSRLTSCPTRISKSSNPRHE